MNFDFTFFPPSAVFPLYPIFKDGHISKYLSLYYKWLALRFKLVINLSVCVLRNSSTHVCLNLCFLRSFEISMQLADTDSPILYTVWLWKICLNPMDSSFITCWIQVRIILSCPRDYVRYGFWLGVMCFLILKEFISPWFFFKWKHILFLPCIHKP